MAKSSLSHFPNVSRSFASKTHRFKPRDTSMTKRSLIQASLNHEDELQDAIPIIDKSRFRRKSGKKRDTYFRDTPRSWKNQSKAPRQWARHKRGVTKKSLRTDIIIEMPYKETYPDLYFNTFKERSYERMNRDFESIYKYLFYDQIESSTPDYEEFFVNEFSPDNIDWKDPTSAKNALCYLIKEITEDRDDYDELFTAAGLTPAIKKSLYEV